MFTISSHTRKSSFDKKKGEKKLTAAINAHFALQMHLLRCLAHSTHTHLHIIGRVARPSDDISHTFHHLPAIHANVPDPTGVTQIPNSTREQCMTRDSLNRD